MSTRFRDGGDAEESGGTVTDGRRVVNERVYVAVGREVEENRLTLKWALENFGGNFSILHVHQTSSPSGHQSGNSRSRNHQEMEMQKMHTVLNEYIHMCNQAEVFAEKRYVVMTDIGKGIVELIEQHAITKLVMGAAADHHYIEDMTELKSMKATFVNQHAHPSCYIWFICNGHLVFMREGKQETFDSDVTPSMLSTNPTAGSSQSVARSPRNSVLSEYDSSEVEDDLALVRYERGGATSHGTYSNTGNGASWIGGGTGSAELYEQLERAMKEVADAKREALEEFLRRQSAEKAVVEASCRARAAENLYTKELNRRKALEEMLTKEKKVVEVTKNQNDELKMLLENKLKANEEVSLDRVSEPSSLTRQQSLSQFSFSEIQEGTGNFDPSLKIYEGPCGSAYKGFLRHTEVPIEMSSSDSSEGPSAGDGVSRTGSFVYGVPADHGRWDSDIEDEMMRVAIEASKQEILVNSGHRLPVTQAGAEFDERSIISDDEQLDRAISLSLMEAEREAEKHKHPIKNTEEKVGARELLLPQEPARDNEGAISLVVRMPDGSRHGCRFLVSDRIQSVFDFVDSGGWAKPRTYRLVRPYPREAFSAADSSSSLGELGITNKQEALFLELL